MEATSDWIWQVDQNGIYTYVSPKIMDILGYEPEEIIGKTPFDFMPKKEREKISQKFGEFVKHKCSFYNLEKWNLHKNGSLILLETSGVPIKNEKGQLVGYRGIDRDITERKNLEKQLQDNKRLAIIGATAGMVGHDIRNPLQAMMSDIFLIRSELTNTPPKTNENANESLDSLEKNIMYINKIVADLQDYSRSLKPEVTIVELSDVIVSAFDTIIVPDNIQLSMSFTGLPKLRTDFALIQRVLTNLVNNAIQAMPMGGKLALAGFVKDQSLYITVSDTGIGIPQEFKHKLFEPMFTTKAKGQGLGLAVAKRIVESLKGTINFESEEGKGTKFIIKLPLN